MSDCKLPVSELLSYQCSMRWQDLTSMRDEDKRFCAGCQTIVHVVRTERDLRMAQAFGRCVANSLEPARPMLLGKVAPGPASFKRDR
jgi:hypothetical protein